MTYSDNENEYFSDTYKDEIDTKDDILNDLKRLSNKHDIKALRQYIIINRSKLKDYKTRLLNEVVNVKGYKFLRRDGKLIIVKISPSSKYYKPDDSKSEYAPMKTDIESIASYAEFDGFSESTPPLNRLRNDNIQQKPTNNNLQEAERTPKPLGMPSKVDYIACSNNDMTTPLKPNLLSQDCKPEYKAEISNTQDKAIDEAQGMKPLTTLRYLNEEKERAPFQNPDLTNILNSIYKQANEQNENQRTQYERLTKTLNDSIQAKNIAEQEQINKVNNVITTIEKTFSAVTFDRIIEHIDNMVSRFVSNQDAKNNDFNNKFECIDGDINELLDRTKQQQIAINEISAHNMDNIEDNETIHDMSISINELNEKIEEQEDTINKLKTGYEKLFKQHADLINKLSLAVYNIDENVFNQIFNNQEQQEKATNENE